MFESLSESLHIFLITLPVIVVLRYIVSEILSWYQLPPGPMGIPILGYMPFLGSEPYKKLVTLSEKYGPVMSIRMGLRNVVFLNGWEACSEAFRNDTFNARPEVMPFNIFVDLRSK